MSFEESRADFKYQSYSSCQCFCSSGLCCFYLFLLCILFELNFKYWWHPLKLMFIYLISLDLDAPEFLAALLMLPCPAWHPPPSMSVQGDITCSYSQWGVVNWLGSHGTAIVAMAPCWQGGGASWTCPLGFSINPFSDALNDSSVFPIGWASDLGRLTSSWLFPNKSFLLT